MGFGNDPLGSRSPLDIFREHTPDTPIDLRQFVYGVRAQRKLEDGRPVYVDGGDRSGAVYFAPDPGGPGRGLVGRIGQWSFGAMSIEKPDGLRALLDDLAAEAGLAAKVPVPAAGAPAGAASGDYRNAYGHPLPHGTVGILHQASTQDKSSLWLLPSLELVAHHAGATTTAAAPDCSTRVYDLTPDGYLDWPRGAGLHSHLWVRGLETGERAALWNLRASAGDATGWGSYYCDGDGGGDVNGIPFAHLTGTRGSFATVAYASWLRGGPFHPGHAVLDKHRLGENAEGESVNPGHLWIEALFYEDRRRDGPKEHGPDYPKRVIDRVVPTKVYEGWDDKTGRWRRWTTTPIIPPPWVPWKPPTDKVPPGVPVTPGEGVPVGGGGGGVPTGEDGEAVIRDFWLDIPHPQLEPGQAITVGSSNPMNPALFEGELGLPSIQLTGSRDRDTQPGDGRFGGTGQDTEFDQGGGVAVHPPDPAPAQAGSSHATQPADEFGVAAGPQGAFGRLNRGRNQGGSGFGDAGHESAPVTFVESPTPGRVGSLTASAKRRGGPVPLSAHLYSLPAVAADGRWDYLSSPGAVWGNGTPTWAALCIAPGGVIPDGIDDQTAWVGALDVLLDQGWRGGSVTGTRFGWGEPLQTAADWRDGVVFSLSGSAGSLDMRLDYRDGSAVARAGTFTHYGHYAPGADNTYDLGTATAAVRRLYVGDGSAGAPSIAFDDTDTGLYSGGANQINFATSGAVRCRVNAAALGPAGSATTVGALSDPWANGYFTALTVTGKLTVGGLIDPAGLVLTEQAANPWTPAAGYGALWVKDTAPSSLRYCNDAGTDVPVAMGANLASNTTDVGNVGVGEDDLMSCTVPAATLAAAGDRIEWEAAFTTAIATVRIRIYFGATVIYDSGSLVMAATGVLVVRGAVVRTGAATQAAWAGASGIGTGAAYSEPAETLANAIAIKATGEATLNDDVVQKGLTVRYVPAP